MRRAGNRKPFATGIAFAGLLAGVCHAAPSNDNWASRAAIGALPFTETVETIEQATTETTDPLLYCVNAGYPTQGVNTVWYEFTTGATEQFVDIEAGDYDSLLAVFAGSPADGFTMVRGGCNDDDPFFKSKLVGLRLAANTRYSIVVAVYPPFADPSMTLTFSMKTATIYTVTKTDDTADGICDADCSLREAVAQSEQAPGAIIVPAGTYVVPGGLTATRAGAIYGAGMRATVIKGQGDGHVLTHSASDRLTYALHDLTLSGGSVPADDILFRASGGAFNAGYGYFTLDRVALLDSHATAGNGGGASFWYGTSASIYDSVVTGNTTGGEGGAIHFYGANLEVQASTIAGNKASTGGGVHMLGAFGVRLLDTTVSGNEAAGDVGGVHIGAGYPSRRIVINNSTIVNNTAGSVPSAQNGGLQFVNSAVSHFPPVVTNTVLSGNHLSSDPAVIFDCGAPDGFAIRSGYNLVQAPNGCTFAASGNVTGVDPQLLPLSTYGTIPVHVPADSSPLIDAGDPGDSCERTDARGVVRPVDGDVDGTSRCDIGAVEKTGPGEGGDTLFADSFE